MPLANTPVLLRLRPPLSEFWMWPALASLFVAVLARLLTAGGDVLNYDDYALMMDVEASFGEYLRERATYMLPSRVHYWLSFRLFGGELSDFLTLSVASSIATIIVVFYGLPRVWKDRGTVTFIALSLLAVNEHLLSIAGYAVWRYSNSLFISTLLFFLFLHIAQGRLTRRSWVLIAIAGIPLAFFSNIIMVVPIATGVISVLLFRLLMHAGKQRWQIIKSSLLEMSPLAVFPLVYLALYSLAPFTNIGADKRPDMADYFFNTSDFAGSFTGGIRYVISGSESLLREMLSPIPLVPLLFISLTLTLMLVLKNASKRIDSAAGTIIQAEHAGTRDAAGFTLLYVCLTYLVISVSGLASEYPFGTVRYAGYLVVPLHCLLAYGVSYITVRLVPRAALNFTAARIRIALPLFLLALSAGFLWQLFQTNRTNKADIAAAFEMVRSATTDTVLYSLYHEPTLQRYAPQFIEQAHAQSLGWGAFWGGGSDGGVDPEVSRSLANSRTVLFILQAPTELQTGFPSYAERIENKFNLVSEARAPNLWVGKYERIQ